MVRVHTVSRPYLLTFPATRTSYVLPSDEAQRLIDNYPVVKATRGRVQLRADDGQVTTLQAATHGGGVAFVVEGEN